MPLSENAVPSVFALCQAGVTVRRSGSAKDFLQFPSPSKLIQLGTGRASAILQELGGQSLEVDAAVSALIRISSVVTPGNKKATEAACDCADKLLSEVMKSDPEKQGPLVSNSILVHLGLIKGEDKSYKAPSDITGPLLVLTHAVQQEYFTKAARDILLAFICKRQHIPRNLNEFALCSIALVGVEFICGRYLTRIWKKRLTDGTSSYRPSIPSEASV